MVTKTSKKKLSWKDIERLTDELGSKIRASGFKPDYLVGITVGGLVPLALVAKELGINRILTVAASSYEKNKQGKLTIIHLPEADLRDKKVLLIDEVADTGTTLKKVAEALRKKCQAAELKTATIGVNTNKCLFWPDFFATEENAWIVFPWERKDFPEYFKGED